MAGNGAFLGIQDLWIFFFLEMLKGGVQELEIETDNEIVLIRGAPEG
jgi:hypothetical protein